MFTRLQVERFAPALLAVICMLAWWYWGLDIPDQVAKELLAALLSAAAICAGFLTTAMAILLPMGESAVGHRLRRRGKLPYLYSYLRAAVYSCLALVAVCIVGFFRFTPGFGVSGVMSIVIVGVCAYFIGAMARVIEVIIKILIGMSESPHEE